VSDVVIAVSEVLFEVRHNLSRPSLRHVRVTNLRRRHHQVIDVSGLDLLYLFHTFFSTSSNFEAMSKECVTKLRPAPSDEATVSTTLRIAEYFAKSQLT
jgi:hypothetical protein